MAHSPPDPCLVHPLPQAPDFLGRDADLKALQSTWASGVAGVLALVGLGGSGKTALAARFLEDLVSQRASPRPTSLFVWSFYQEPDPGLFLRELYRYLAGDDSAEASVRGAGLLQMLQKILDAGGPHLLVLDGLERVQQQDGATGDYGRLDDPLLRAFLVRLAEGPGQTLALVTSRFPLTDVMPLAGYHQRDVEDLDAKAATELLRRRGVRGDEGVLADLVKTYGAHPLTLDHLGTLIGQFLDGDPARAPEAPALTARVTDHQAARLARLLAAYERHLPERELALLCRLSTLRRGVDDARLLDLFLCSPPVQAHAVRETTSAVARLSEIIRLPSPDDRHWVAAVHQTLEEALCATPMAGPENVFKAEVCDAVETATESCFAQDDFDLETLAHLYAGAVSTEPDEQRPLAATERTSLRDLYVRYCELRDHPLLPFKEPPPLLKAAFHNLGIDKPRSRTGEDLGPADVLRAFTRVRQRLSALAALHLALRRIRSLCRQRQQKWSLAGPLAPLTRDELLAVRDALVQRRLVLRGQDGSLEVHPAVRDHFGRLGSAAERGQWHGLLRAQLVSLALRPGRELPDDPVALDLVEEAIHHAAEAGQGEEAFKLYSGVLGGLRHLGWRLGEMARGCRILRGLQPCPDRWALGWYLRALGELDEAYRHNELPYFRADVRLLQGRLPEVAAEGDATRSATAAFLMGATQDLPPTVLGCAVPRAQVLLYLGRLDMVQPVTELAELYGDLGWEGERARCQLLAAEAARRLRDPLKCHSYIEAAARWALHAGSIEHLCLLYLVRARAALDAGMNEPAKVDVQEGLRLARGSGLWLYHVELLCVQAEVSLAQSDAAAAEAVAREAVQRTRRPDCRFARGQTVAQFVLGRSLLARSQLEEARSALQSARDLGELIGDPGVYEVDRILQGISK